MHGLTTLYMANEPQLPFGSGHYGSLIPAELALLRSAWELESSEGREEQVEKD